MEALRRRRCSRRRQACGREQVPSVRGGGGCGEDIIGVGRKRLAGGRGGRKRHYLVRPLAGCA